MSEKTPSLVEPIVSKDLSSEGNRLFPVFLKLEHLSLLIVGVAMLEWKNYQSLCRMLLEEK